MKNSPLAINIKQLNQLTLNYKDGENGFETEIKSENVFANIF
jgi:hypothetical protein